MSQLTGSKVQFFFSDSQRQSADIVSSLLKREAKRGFELPRPFALTKHQERVLLPFYQVRGEIETVPERLKEERTSRCSR